MNKKLRNVLVFSVWVIVVALAFLIRSFMFREPPSYAIITVDGNLFGSYRLDQEQEIMVELPEGGYNLVVIQNGTAWVDEADCRNQDCMRQGKISKSGESIICLPHRVIIRIAGEGEPEYDAITE